MRSITCLAALLLATTFFGCSEEDATIGTGETFGTSEVGEVNEQGIFVNECSLTGTGRDVGDQVADVELMNCYGEPVNLHSYCGRRKALWIIGSAGWCGACSQYVPQAAQVAWERRHEGVELVVVVGEDPQSNPATTDYCMQYAEQYGLDPARVWISGGDTLNDVWGSVSPGGGGSVGLPWEAVLDPYDMEYVWTNAQDPAPVGAVLDELVSD